MDISHNQTTNELNRINHLSKMALQFLLGAATSWSMVAGSDPILAGGVCHQNDLNNLLSALYNSPFG